MRKIHYVIMLGVLMIVMGFSCFGCPGTTQSKYDGPSTMSSVITTGSIQEIELKNIGETSNQLIGLWQADNRKTNTYSQLRFNADGTFQEDIYRELNHEFKASLNGSYSVDNNRLTIILTNSGLYKFEYHLAIDRLKLYPIIEND
jgi:hypothetical protein